MKKLLYLSVIALAGLFAACTQEHIDAIFNPDDVTVQQLGNAEGCTLAEDGADISFPFSAADFGEGLVTTYSFYISKDASMVEKSLLSSTISESEGKITVAQKTMNSTLLNMGAEAGSAFTAYFVLESALKTDKNAAVTGTQKLSNVVSVEFVPYQADIKDVDKYPHVWVIGASGAVGAWSFDKVFQYLYDYDGSGTYTGIIDFGEEGPSGGFKLTGVGNWDDPDKNWGSAAQAEEAEAATIQLVAGGGSKDIKCYSKRFYSLSFNPSTLVLVAATAFDNVGIVGAFNEWNAADENMKMTYNEYYHRFYIDMTFAEDTELKFTCDDDWAINWGVDCVSGGDNIQVKAGSYRIYLDLNHRSYEFNTNMFGKEEPGAPAEPEPVPVTYEGWGLIGDFNEWGGDVAMTEKDGVWTGYLTVTADQSWKLRKDADWAENVGGVFAALGTPFTAEADGGNICIGQDGFFKVVYDTNAATITITEGDVWSLIGAFNEWAGDLDMENVDGKWVASNVALSGEWKLRYNHDWSVNRGGAFEAFGTAFAVTHDGDNIDCGEGKFNIVYDPEEETVTVNKAMPDNTWSLIGVNGDWDNDIFMNEIMPGVWVSPATAIGGEFKLRFNHGWDVNRGCDPLTLGGAAQMAFQNGPNIAIEDGTYIIVYDANEDVIYVQGWSLIGTLNGASWDMDFPLMPVDSGEDDEIAWISYPFQLDEASEFKFRFNASWDINRGGKFSDFCQPIAAVYDGDNVAVGQAGYFFAAYNPDSEEYSVGHADWGIIGDFNDWSGDVVMYESESGIYLNLTPVHLEAGKGFKIRKDRDWSVNRGATGDVEPFETVTDTEIPVVNNGKNFTVTVDGDYVIMYDSVNDIVKVDLTE